MKAKTVSDSALSLNQVIFPEHTNPFGIAHGGEMLKLMDNAAGACAAKHCLSMVSTRGIYNVDFLAPIQLGSIVYCQAHLTFVSTHAMEIKVELFAENIKENQKKLCITAYFVYVAVDENMQLLEVPPLLLTNEKEKNEFRLGQERMQKRKALDKEKG